MRPSASSAVMTAADSLASSVYSPILSFGALWKVLMRLFSDVTSLRRGIGGEVEDVNAHVAENALAAVGARQPP